MSEFFADENSIIRQSPNLEIEVSLDTCSKLEPVTGVSVPSVALFLSPEKNVDKNSTTEKDVLEASDDNADQLDESSSSSKSILQETSSSEEENDDVRIRRENVESERLAWEMMREESMTAYRMQMEFINGCANQMSAEDLEAIQMAMREGNAFVAESEEIEEEGVEDGAVQPNEDQRSDEEQEDEESDVDQWDYDRLLALGEVIGDVKTERWRLKAKNVIGKLPTTSFCEIQQRQRDDVKVQSDTEKTLSALVATDSSSPKYKRVRHDPSCAVCMEVFIGEDELNVLPCQHYFHQTCTQGWLADHNNCPVCKSVVSSTP